MSHIEHAQDDLRFVRDALSRAESAWPTGVSLLWAGLILAGGIVTDARPMWAGWYWLTAAPLGFVASAMLGRDHSRRLGQISDDGRRELLHWGSLMGALAFAILLLVTGQVTHKGLGGIMLLLVGFSYVQAGIHLHRTLLSTGLCVGAGYVLALFVQQYAWTVAGAVIALALIAQAISQRGTDDSQR
jgi:hypothetical protein